MILFVLYLSLGIIHLRFILDFVGKVGGGGCEVLGEVQNSLHEDPGLIPPAPDLT